MPARFADQAWLVLRREGGIHLVVPTIALQGDLNRVTITGEMEFNKPAAPSCGIGKGKVYAHLAGLDGVRQRALNPLAGNVQPKRTIGRCPVGIDDSRLS